MGEVYRAHDTRLNRDVAIKILPASFASDPERRARFEREAQAVASLSHPNVLAIHDTGTHDGQMFVVTELLEGETLAARLKAGPLPVRKALDVAVQIARGLAAAHDKQVVHRDLKPDNLFLIRDGRVKILDFGLARHLPSFTGATQTVAAATDPGVVMGTVGYMAPEQVRGEHVDARADLFAFGAVFYEMLTGQRAFRRDTAAETMTAILRDEPPELTQQRADLSPALDRIVRHCLEKDPSQRFQSARDIAFALESLSGSSPTQPVPVTAPPTARRSSWIPLAAAVIAVAGAGAAFWWWSGQPRPVDPTPAVISIGTATQVTADDGLEIDAAISPDGRLLAYAAGTATHMRIFIRPVGGGRTITLSEEPQALEYQPRWSPDGSQILYLTQAGAFLASALGGKGQRVAAPRVDSAAWAADGKRILLVRGDDVSLIDANGGNEQPLGKAREPHSCAWSPDDRWVACVSGNRPASAPGLLFGNISPTSIVLVPVGGGAPVDLVEQRGTMNHSPVWSPDGRQLYFVSNRQGPRDIYVAEIGNDGRAHGEPQRVTTGLGVYSMAFSAKGERLTYVTYTARANIWSLPVPARGPVDISAAKVITSGNQIIEAMTVSPDGRWLVYDSNLHLNAEIFRMPIGGGPVERLTTDPAHDFCPDVSLDGTELAYHSWKTGSRDIFVTKLDGGTPQQLTATPSQEAYPSWSPDGRSLAYWDNSGGRRSGSRCVPHAARVIWNLDLARLTPPGHELQSVVASGRAIARGPTARCDRNRRRRSKAIRICTRARRQVIPPRRAWPGQRTARRSISRVTTPSGARRSGAFPSPAAARSCSCSSATSRVRRFVRTSPSQRASSSSRSKIARRISGWRKSRAGNARSTNPGKLPRVDRLCGQDWTVLIEVGYAER